MGLSEYYEILGLPVNSSIDEIKKAYRKKARLFHPDINHAPDAVNQFIKLTEAYDFIIANHGRAFSGNNDYEKVMEEWRKYRQGRSRQRANYYARSSYNRFKNSKYYRSTRILNASTIILSFIISILVLIYTIVGYIFRLHHPLTGIENPSIFTFILLLIFSLILLIASSIYLKAYIETTHKQRSKK